MTVLEHLNSAKSAAQVLRGDVPEITAKRLSAIMTAIETAWTEHEREIAAARNAALEEAAALVDHCNREGPYNAIGAASRIRELKK